MSSSVRSKHGRWAEGVVPHPNSLENLKGGEKERRSCISPHAIPGNDSRFDMQGPPKRHIVVEKAWHRQIVQLSIQGFSIKEIAGIVGRCEWTCTNVLRQDRSQKYMVDTIKKTAHQQLMERIEQAAGPALERVLACAEDAVLKTKDPKTYIQANQEILNRFLGKPSQPLEHRNVNPDTLTDEELANLAGRARSPLLD